MARHKAKEIAGTDGARESATGEETREIVKTMRALNAKGRVGRLVGDATYWLMSHLTVKWGVKAYTLSGYDCACVGVFAQAQGFETLRVWFSRGPRCERAHPFNGREASRTLTNAVPEGPEQTAPENNPFYDERRGDHALMALPPSTCKCSTFPCDCQPTPLRDEATYGLTKPEKDALNANRWCTGSNPWDKTYSVRVVYDRAVADDDAAALIAAYDAIEARGEAVACGFMAEYRHAPVA